MNNANVPRLTMAGHPVKLKVNQKYHRLKMRLIHLTSAHYSLAAMYCRVAFVSLFLHGWLGTLACCPA